MTPIRHIKANITVGRQKRTTEMFPASEKWLSVTEDGVAIVDNIESTSTPAEPARRSGDRDAGQAS